MQTSASALPVGQYLSRNAGTMGDHTAVIFAAEDGREVEISWKALEQRANQSARFLADQGLKHGDRIVIGLRNSPEHLYLTWGAWKLGATVVPLRWDLPGREWDELLHLAKPRISVGSPEQADSNPDVWTLDDLVDISSYDDSSLETGLAPSSLAILGSGGSTGRPKLIDLGVPGTIPSAVMPRFYNGERLGDPTNLRFVGGPLYHVAPFAGALTSIIGGTRLLLIDRFAPERVVDLIERRGVTALILAPIMMQRIAAIPDLETRDFSSIQAIKHTGGPCPAWVKQTWLDLVRPENVYETYGMSEGIGRTMIRGDEWLHHPGSVGRPPQGVEISILDEGGETLPAGEIGLIHFRGDSLDTPGKGSYIGADPPTANHDGFVTIGDLGWLDDEGFLYIADRRTDMIVSGGANVFPAEVEGALSEHPQVDDVVVVGLPDAEWGRTVHAIVQPSKALDPPDESDLDAHVRERLARYKAPKSYEFLPHLPRDDAGKIRRSALAAERSTQD